MRSSENIEKLVKNLDLDIDTNDQTDQSILNELLEAQEKSQKTQSAFVGPNIRRQIMKSPMTKLAVAALVVVACVVGLSLWLETGSGIVLADVLTRIEQVSAFMYHTTITHSGPKRGDTPGNSETYATSLISQDYGAKFRMESNDPDRGQTKLQEMYMLPQKKTAIMILPDEKKYIRLEFNDELLDKKQKEYNDPRAMLKKVLKCNYKSLGQSTIDGITVEGFQTTDPRYAGNGLDRQVDVRIWVDVETWLPIRSEEDVVTDDNEHMHSVSYDFQWNVPVNMADFEPVIPDDYTSMTSGPITVPAMNEEIAIKGLRLYAEQCSQYPEQLGRKVMMSFIENMPEVRELSEQEKDELFGDPEKVKNLVDTMMPIAGLIGFHKMLAEGNKELAYYGNIVMPDDAEQILMRWKDSDGEYRVIFGDLHAETVSTDVLVELEKRLPK